MYVQSLVTWFIWLQQAQFNSAFFLFVTLYSKHKDTIFNGSVLLFIYPQFSPFETTISHLVAKCTLSAEIKGSKVTILT